MAERAAWGGDQADGLRRLFGNRVPQVVAFASGREACGRTTLVVQTMYGSAKLLADSGEHTTVLRERVTSPGGTTAAALRELEANRVKAAFITAMEAARDRSRELAGS